MENWIRCQKIISESCELVNLCHINCSGPVFFETHCRYYSATRYCWLQLINHFLSDTLHSWHCCVLCIAMCVVSRECAYPEYPEYSFRCDNGQCLDRRLFCAQQLRNETWWYGCADGSVIASEVCSEHIPFALWLITASDRFRTHWIWTEHWDLEMRTCGDSFATQKCPRLITQTQSVTSYS